MEQILLNLWNWLKSKINNAYCKFLGIVIGICGLIYLINSIFPGAPYKPLQFGDILYYKEYYMGSDQKFLTERDGKWFSSNFFVTRKINFFDSDIYVKDFIMNHKLVNVSWGPDGETIGFTYIDDTDDLFVSPGLINSTGVTYICPPGESLATYYAYPIQVLDRERVVVNTGEWHENYLAQYNMRTCIEESVYFDGEEERLFFISSKDWLAVSERKHGNYLNIYDDQKNLVLSILLKDMLDWASWSADGNQLLYRDYWGMSYRMYNYNFLTGETTVIGEKILSATYSPDGNWIVYHKDDGIHLLDVETGLRYFLIEGSSPQWRP